MTSHTGRGWMIVRLIFHHVFGRGNLVSSCIKGGSLWDYHHFMWCGAARDSQNLKATAHKTWVHLHLVSRTPTTLLDLFLFYWPLLQSLLCWSLFMFPISKHRSTWDFSRWASSLLCLHNIPSLISSSPLALNIIWKQMFPNFYL